ncbi:MAG TPA: DHA2 family efflux MFS transporter permease subunit, partial [Candidatus Binataceae bacterium]|nr:DHA2 family efflux MFS transporter permease subunit [Candidatus Binataceae bacterium]
PNRLNLSNAQLAPLIVGCALLMEMLDSTIISTALPVIARSMHEDPIRLNLAITSYLLALAVFIPISGWMADRYGARTVFRTAIVIFTCGSILCGAAHSLPQLVASRILQGFGGAMMVPVGRLIVLRMVRKSELVTAMSYLTVPAILGPVLGPPLGGFIVTYYSWRWIFYINVPIGIIGFMLVTIFIENVREEDVFPLDFTGFVLTGIGLAALVLGCEMVGRGILPVPVVIAILVGGLLSLAAYVLHEQRVKYPIINLELINIHTFAASTLGGGLFRMGIGALPFLLPMLLQLVFGLSPFESGMLTFTSAMGALFMKVTAVPVIRRFGFRNVLIGNGVIASMVLMSYALFKASTPHYVIILALLSGGFLRSLQFTALGTLAYADVPNPLMSNASSLSSMAQQLFLSFGVAIAALLLHLSLGGRPASMLTQRDFVIPFVIVGMLGILSSLLFVSLAHDAGEEVSGRRTEVVVSNITPEPAASPD